MAETTTKGLRFIIEGQTRDECAEFRGADTVRMIGAEASVRFNVGTVPPGPFSFGLHLSIEEACELADALMRASIQADPDAAAVLCERMAERASVTA